MPRREVPPPVLPDVPFAALSAAEQARCVAWNLRLARKRCGFTLPALASHMQAEAPDEALSLSYLGDIERGTRTPSLISFLAYVRVLGIDPGVLFCRVGELPPVQPACGASVASHVDADPT